MDQSGQEALMESDGEGNWSITQSIAERFLAYYYLVDGNKVLDEEAGSFWIGDGNGFVNVYSKPSTTDIRVPDEMAADLEEIQFKLITPDFPPFYYRQELPEKTLEFANFGMLKFYLKLTQPTHNGIFEASIYDRNDKLLWRNSVPSFTVRDASFMDLNLAIRKPLRDVDHITFRVSGAGKEFSVRKPTPKPATHRLYGRVTDFDDRPVGGSFVLAQSENWEAVATYCNEDGYYQLELPEGLYRRNWASDPKYRDTHLENYFIDLVLDKDTELNLRIGALEVYQLNAAPVSETGVIQGQFTVWSVSSLQGRDVGDPAAFTPITREEVGVYLNGTLCKLKILNKVSRLADDRERELEGWYFEALVPHTVERKERNELKVVINHKAKGVKGDTVVEKGQAQYLNCMWP